MIYKLTFDDGRIDWCTAKDQLHLLKSYDADFDLSLQELESINEISEDESKTVMVKNEDYDELSPEDSGSISLFELAVNNDFCIIATNTFD